MKVRAVFQNIVHPAVHEPLERYTIPRHGMTATTLSNKTNRCFKNNASAVEAVTVRAKPGRKPHEPKDYGFITQRIEKTR
jgi:hypothetical protein